MKTYAETQDLDEVFNWNKFLDKKANHTVVDLMLAARKAGNWVSCACGNSCAIIPRKMDGEPEDEQLVTLGIDFYNHVSNMRRAKVNRSIRDYVVSRLRAKDTLAAIDRRSDTIIRAMIAGIKSKRNLKRFDAVREEYSKELNAVIAKLNGAPSTGKTARL